MKTPFFLIKSFVKRFFEQLPQIYETILASSFNPLHKLWRIPKSHENERQRLRNVCYDIAENVPV